MYDVASATAYPPRENEVCHTVSLLPGHLKVKIQKVPDEFLGLPLPVPVPAFEIEAMENAIGTYVQWPTTLIRFSVEATPKVKKLKRMSPEMIFSNELASGLSASRKSPDIPDTIVDSLSQECEWLRTFVASMPDGDSFEVILDGTSFHYNENGKIQVDKNDISQFLRGAKLNISIIQVFMRALQHELNSNDKASKVGWLCPDTTSDTKIKSSTEEVNAYIFKAMNESVKSRNEFVLAPIFENDHWMLLAISVKNCTIYHFDSICLSLGRKIKMKTIVRHFFTRYKMCGNRVNRKEPLWKYVECAQQKGGLECGFYVMRYMFDLVSCCNDVSDLEKVCTSMSGDPFTDEQIDEIRDKWASYFTEHCV
ncbi:uncharacterized protein [Spinacia oleracea]|nr:uncharacterized protein LOC130471276 [Spinacia oleracea]